MCCVNPLISTLKHDDDGDTVYISYNITCHIELGILCLFITYKHNITLT